MARRCRQAAGGGLLLLMAFGGGCLEPVPDDAALHAIELTAPAAPAPARDAERTAYAAARALEHARQAYIKASDPDAGDQFGHSVALAGNILAVGAPFEDSGAAGVNGDQDDNSTDDSGAVYAFH